MALALSTCSSIPSTHLMFMQTGRDITAMYWPAAGLCCRAAVLALAPLGVMQEFMQEATDVAF
jgi:hypothetical protein